MHMRNLYLRLPLLILVTALHCGCSGTRPAASGAKKISGTLVVLQAGSLTVPFKEIAAGFEKEYPGVKVVCTAAGSRKLARMIAEQKKPCDVMASADYTVIDTLLIPDHADWNIKFATNEMALAYRHKSKGAKEISAGNWHQVLLRKDVAFARTDPNLDPCGYRAVLTMKLAEKHYKIPGLAAKLLAKDKYVRAKETDVLALLETGEIDYVFLYRSVAEQHKLERVILPDQINLKSQKCADFYKTATVNISGKTPGSKVTKKGAPMVYGVTVPKNAPNREAALAFVEYLLSNDRGIAVMAKSGQPSAVPSPTKTYAKIPPRLRKFASSR
jgi:molybdate/tungstate transport system substrate-binding protein